MGFLESLAHIMDTPKKRYLAALKWESAGAKYRKQTIKAYLAYLNGEIYEKAYKGRLHSHCSGTPYTMEEEINLHVARCYSALAKAYEGEYDFDRAVDCLKRCIQLIPSISTYYILLSLIYIKKNEIDTAIDFLKSTRNLPYYKPQKCISWPDEETFIDDDFYRSIECFIKEAVEKKTRGYVYRPRKKIIPGQRPNT